MSERQYCCVLSCMVLSWINCQHYCTGWLAYGGPAAGVSGGSVSVNIYRRLPSVFFNYKDNAYFYSLVSAGMFVPSQTD